MKPYIVKVEPDDMPTMKGRYMVVIFDPDGSVHGIPIRGLKKERAEELLRPIFYAFEYGFGAAQEVHHKVQLAAKVEE